MAGSTKAQVAEAKEVLAPPPAKDLEAVRSRRYEVKDILNTNLLSLEARKEYEDLYAELGDILEKAAAKAAEK